MNEIDIKINGFDENLSLKVLEAFKKIVNNLSFLDLRRLSTVIISSNFNNEVNKLSTQNSLKYRYKVNSDTYALVLTFPKKDDFELVMVFQSQFLLNILEDENSKEYKNAFHIINHEFAHIHDNNKKIDAFHKIMKEEKYRGKDSFITPIAETCWSEYIANFISSQSALETEFPNLIAHSLVEKIKRVMFDVSNSILAYKINKKRDDLIEDSLAQIESLIKTASYLIGYLNGLKITLDELDDKVSLSIESSYFKYTWERLKYELASIHQVYPYGFVNLNIYKNLSFIIEDLFSELGIIFSENERKELQIQLK